MKYKYMGNIVTYINGVPLKDCNLTTAPGGATYYKFKKGDVDTFRVSKKVDGRFIGLSKLFKSKLEAWDYLVQFEEGNIL